MGNIKIYPSVLPGEPLETHHVDGVALEQWLIDTVPSYERRDEPPISIAVNGELVAPAAWAETVIQAADDVEIRPQPKDPATALIAAAVAAVVSVAAATLLRPSVPKSQSRGQGTSLFEANAKANQPRLGDVIPEQAGLQKAYPDYLTAPRRRFTSPRNQVLDLLLCVGRGDYDIPPSEIRIGETPITALGAAVDYQLFAPGESVTGHIAHENWFNSPEVGASNGAAGIPLRNIEDHTYQGPVTASGKSLNFPVPSAWETGMLLDVQRPQQITITDGGVNTQQVEVVTSLTITNGGLKTVVTDVETVTDAEGNIIAVNKTTGEVIDGTVSEIVTDTVTQETPQPDILTGDWAGLAVGQRARIVHPDFGGVYRVATRSGSQMTLTTLGGAPVTDLPPGTHIARVDRDGALYRVDSIAGNRQSLSATRMIGSSPDATWTAFPSAGYGDATIAAGTESARGPWVGPFRACPSSEKVTQTEYDLFFPRGIAYVDENVGWHTTTLEVQWRDSALGGAWTTINHSYRNNTLDQIGYTQSVTHPYPMVPEFRARVTRGGTESEMVDECVWYGLRARLPNATSYPGVTVLAMTVNGTEGIASRTENQVSVTGTRVLPSLVDGQWTAPQPTRHIADWFGHVVRSAGYTDDDIDMMELNRLNEKWRARGDLYDYTEADASTVKEAMNRCLRAGMAEFTVDNGLIRPVRDEPRSTSEHQYHHAIGAPGHMYTLQNMTTPLKRSATLPRPDDPDGVDVEYIDSTTWAKSTVECRLPGDNGYRAEKIRLEGVVNRTRAWRIGMRRRRELKYRLWDYSFSTELDALNSRYMSYADLADDIPGYGQSAWLKSVAPASGGYRLEVSEPMEWQTGEQHVVAWRRPDGTRAGPFPASRGADEFEIIASVTGESMPITDHQQEPPHVLFGTIKTWSYPALIVDISPNGFESVNVSAVNYDERVYASDDASPP